MELDDIRTKENLTRVAGFLAVTVAAIHLLHPTLGAPGLLIYMQAGTLVDPRPLAFVVSGFAIVVGMIAVYNGAPRKPVYATGAVLMLIYIAGYAAWHTVLEHGAFWPHLEAHGHHDAGTFEVIWIHLRDDSVAFASKLVEAALLVVLVVLYAKEE